MHKIVNGKKVELTKKEIDKKKADDAIAEQHFINEVRANELRELLRESDYKVMPDYDKPNEDIKTKRQEWRDELRSLI